MQILVEYGLQSREVMSKYKLILIIKLVVAIDEEINSLVKHFHSDQKTLNGIFNTYKERKKDKIEKSEIDQRKNVINILGSQLRTFLHHYEE